MYFVFIKKKKKLIKCIVIYDNIISLDRFVNVLFYFVFEYSHIPYHF